MGVRAGGSAGAGLRKATEGEKDTGGAGWQSGAVSGEESSTSMKQRLPNRRPERVWGGRGVGSCCSVCPATPATGATDSSRSSPDGAAACRGRARKATCRAVNAKPLTDADRRDGAPETLGDLLYADRTKTRVSETEWIGLVQSIAAGDQLALHALYERTVRIVFTLIVRITHNRETAEELTLDVFHDVWRRAASYDPAGGSVVGWIMNQARSRAIDRLRFEQRKKRVNTLADSLLPTTGGSEPDEAFNLSEQGRLLRDALTVLTPDERQAIETAFFSEMTYAEVAARLNEPLGTVKTRIRSGLSKLRQRLMTDSKAP